MDWIDFTDRDLQDLRQRGMAAQARVILADVRELAQERVEGFFLGTFPEGLPGDDHLKVGSKIVKLLLAAAAEISGRDDSPVDLIHEGTLDRVRDEMAGGHWLDPRDAWNRIGPQGQWRVLAESAPLEVANVLQDALLAEQRKRAKGRTDWTAKCDRLRARHAQDVQQAEQRHVIECRRLQEGYDRQCAEIKATYAKALDEWQKGEGDDLFDEAPPKPAMPKMPPRPPTPDPPDPPVLVLPDPPVESPIEVPAGTRDVIRRWQKFLTMATPYDVWRFWQDVRVRIRLRSDRLLDSYLAKYEEGIGEESLDGAAEEVVTQALVEVGKDWVQRVDAWPDPPAPPEQPSLPIFEFPRVEYL